MERIGREVERELARSGSRDALPLAAVTSVWPQAVGEGIAREAWPRRLGRDGTLHVATSSATWAFELDRLAPRIVLALRDRLAGDAPAKVRFAVGPIPAPASPEEGRGRPAPPPPDVPPDVESAAASAASAIEDADLRELVARAARASLLRARDDRSF